MLYLPLVDKGIHLPTKSNHVSAIRDTYFLIGQLDNVRDIGQARPGVFLSGLSSLDGGEIMRLKKAASAALAGVMVLSLAACGKAPQTGITDGSVYAFRVEK